MAIKIVSTTGGNWNATTTWVGGVVPVAGTDTVAFVALSGQLTVNVTSSCQGIDFTNYVNTITFTAGLTVQGPINLGTGGYTQVGPFGITVNSNIGGAGFTNGGVVWSVPFTFAGGGATAVYTLNDDWNFTGTLSFNNTSVMTINGFNIYTTNLSVGATGNNNISGTTNIIFNGTGTWSHTNAGTYIKNNITINTTGTLTISGNIYCNTGTLTYTQGTVITIGSTLNTGNTGTTTLNTYGIIWNIIIMGGSTNIVTLTSSLYCAILASTSVTINTSNNSYIYISNSYSNNSVSGTILGTSKLVLIGTGVWGGSGTQATALNLEINTTGTITLATNVYYNTGTLTYISGKVITKNSTLNISTAATLINCHKILFNQVLITSGITVTMNEFFNGSREKIPTILATSTTNYIINFLDKFEKITKFSNISNCTIANPLQLISITDMNNKGSNKGIRYINQTPNGISKGLESLLLITFGAGGIIKGPN